MKTAEQYADELIRGHKFAWQHSITERMAIHSSILDVNNTIKALANLSEKGRDWRRSYNYYLDVLEVFEDKLK